MALLTLFLATLAAKSAQAAGGGVKRQMKPEGRLATADSDCSVIVSETPGTSTMDTWSQPALEKNAFAGHPGLVAAPPFCSVLFQFG